jgi:hypothetical protein
MMRRAVSTAPPDRSFRDLMTAIRVRLRSTERCILSNIDRMGDVGPIFARLILRHPAAGGNSARPGARRSDEATITTEAAPMALADQLNAAVSAHAAWKVRLAQAIASGASDFAVPTVRLDNQCPFGKWLYGEIDPTLKRSPDYEKVRALHASFHVAAAGVLALALAGKRVEAEAAMAPGSEFARVSTQLTLALTAWQRA